MKKKIIIPLIVICIIFGILSGCTQEATEELEAIFEYNPTGANYINTNITFTDKSTGTDIESRVWDFGDDTKASTENPIHYYAEPGVYMVTLTIVNTNGDTSIATKNITITYKPPTAKFDHPTEDIKVNTALNFTDASIPGDANITSWIWNFGDGTTITDQNPPDHIYTTDAKYTITLTVTDANGLTDTTSVTMSVGPQKTE